MKILALETSSETPAFAAVELDENHAVLRAATHALEKSRQLSRASMLAVDAVLSEAGWTLDDLDAIAVGIGPGSWTGLRIGLTTAKTIAQTRELPLIGVSVFDVLAHGLREMPASNNCLVIAAVPCRPGEIYVQSWLKCGLEMTPRDEPRVVTTQQIADEVIEAALPELIIGFTQTAAPQIEPQTTKLLPYGLFVESNEVVGIDLARIAATRLRNGESDDPLTLAPLYLAPSNAERVLAAKLARETAQRESTQRESTQV